MKREMKGFICGFIVATIGLSTVFAASGIKSASFNANKVIFNDTEINLSSNPMISVIKDGEENVSNYMPVRAVLEAMGYNVDWDGSKNAVIINDRKNTTNESDKNTVTDKSVDDNEINLSEYSLYNPIGNLLAQNGYGSRFMGEDNDIFVDIYNPFPNNEEILVSIPWSSIVMIEARSRIEKSFVEKEIIPLIPSLESELRKLLA